MKTSVKWMWIILDILLLMVTMITLVVLPSETKLNQNLFLAVLLLNLIIGFLFRHEIRLFFKSSFWNFMLNHVIQIFLVFFIFILINYWGVKLNFYKDFSIQNLNSLSEQSLHIAKSVNSEMKITLFAKRLEWDKYLTLLNLYSWKNPLIKIEAVDIETEPAKVASLGIDANGSILIEYQNKKMKGLALDERSITNLLLKILRESIINIYYTYGHGELDFKKIEADGLTYLADQLRYSTYQLKSLDLTQVETVPKDADLVLILGPQNDFLNYELEKLFKYFDRGGAIFISLAPSFNKNSHSDLIKKFTEKFKVTIKNSLVLDRLSTLQGKDASVAIVSQLNKEHPATKSLNQRIIFPMSLALKYESSDEHIIDSLLETTPMPGSWAETNFNDLNVGKAVYDGKTDLPGPISLMLSIENRKTLGRMILSGSSSFFVNAYQGQSGNFNLILNTIAWLTHDEGIISLNRPELTTDKIFMSEEQIRLIFIVSILATPLIMLIFASWFFIRRRKG
jgi:hypothetical protein